MTQRLFLNYAQPDSQIANRVHSELLSAGFAVDLKSDAQLYAANALVVLMSENMLQDAAGVALLKDAANTGKPIFPLYTGNLIKIQIGLPDELQFLTAHTWYEAADTSSWLSSLLSEAADDFEDSSTTGRDIPDDLWDLEGSISESQSPPPTISLPVEPGSTADDRKRAESQWQQSEPPPELAFGGEAETAPEPILFSSYAPKEAVPNVWTSMHAYIFRQSATSAVEADAGALLGEKASDYRRVEQPATAPISEGALIIATPDLPGFQFNPPSASIILLEDWHRFDFKLRPATATVNQAVNGKITFTVEGIIVADIPLSIFVSPQMLTRSGAPTQGQLSPAVSPYRAVFCSYSHQDTAIVERVERAIKLLGYTYLRDATTLRSGENWNAQLMNMIDQADIFQLFWSTRSAQSKYVRQEWEYALKHEAIKLNFIRPVYWEEPMPKVPDELGKLHFEFEPTLDDF